MIGRGDADVTVCIPAWQAAGFIDRTLACARAQTHASIRIVVSVDLGDDDTARRCQGHAQEDDRIEVLVQPRRLGWADNTNATLERVQTEFFCLYFHDDVLKPDFVARLLAELRADPAAVAAYCDVREFGDRESVITGAPYSGPAVERLLKMLGPQRGAPLRALTRRRLLDEGLRFPAVPGQGFWRWYPYLVKLAAAGPLRHVPEALYERWIRADGLTASWQRVTRQDLVEGQRASLAICLDTFDRAAADPGERVLLRYALYLFTLAWTRRAELAGGFAAPIPAGELAAAFADIARPPQETLPGHVRAWLAAGEAELQSAERRLAEFRSRSHGPA